jgi:hypothetical protein
MFDLPGSEEKQFHLTSLIRANSACWKLLKPKYELRSKKYVRERYLNLLIFSTGFLFAER